MNTTTNEACCQWTVSEAKPTQKTMPRDIQPLMDMQVCFPDRCSPCNIAAHV